MILLTVLLCSFCVATLDAGRAVSRYSLDNPTVCHQMNVVTKWLNEEDTVIVHAKTVYDENNEFQECVIKFGPSSESQKKTVQIKVETFYIEECGVFLAVQQSPTAFFNEHVSVIFNFTCHSKPGGNTYHADANSNIKIFLHKKDKALLHYNFILNISLVEHTQEFKPGISSAVMISIAVIVAIAIPGAGCIVYRYLKVKKWSKRQFEAMGGFPQSGLSHMADNSPQDSTRYSNLPLSDMEPTSSIHSQTCIVGSLGSDGLCTVCHRHHADFAHVVDIGPNGEIVNSDNCNHGHHLRHDGARGTERDGLLHGNDSRSSTPKNRRAHQSAGTGQIGHRHLHSQTPGRGSGSRLRPQCNHLVPSNGVTSNVELVDDYDDMDLSGNDLIPPSYDLSPPSYDEAINMPKPDSSDVSPVMSVHVTDVSESDPLYQNIPSSRDER